MSEERIRQLAYDIWNSEGRPHGQEKRHWEMASKLFEAESTSSAAPAKPRAPRKKPVLKEIATARLSTALAVVNPTIDPGFPILITTQDADPITG